MVHISCLWGPKLMSLASDEKYHSFIWSPKGSRDSAIETSRFHCWTCSNAWAKSTPSGMVGYCSLFPIHSSASMHSWYECILRFFRFFLIHWLSLKHPSACSSLREFLCWPQELFGVQIHIFMGLILGLPLWNSQFFGVPPSFQTCPGFFLFCYQTHLFQDVPSVSWQPFGFVNKIHMKPRNNRWICIIFSWF